MYPTFTWYAPRTLAYKKRPLGGHGPEAGAVESRSMTLQFAEDGFDMISIAADMIAIPQYFSDTLAVASGKADGSAAKGGGYDGR